MPKHSMTLDEHEAGLRAEDSYESVRARLKLQEEMRQKKMAESREAEKALIDELISKGLAVSSVWDLVNSKDPYDVRQ
jgi:hypothetical protein